jgi:hypothetical protein
MVAGEAGIGQAEQVNVGTKQVNVAGSATRGED